jgi:hypothetical protein
MNNIYISVSNTPEHVRAVRGLSKPLLHMAYSFQESFPDDVRLSGSKDMMAVSGDLRSVRADDIAKECKTKGFYGVAAGFAYSSAVEVLRLCQALSRKSIRLYLMESAYVRDCGANIIISTALSGGNLEARLKSAVKKYGAQKIALDFELLRHLFPLPNPSGAGEFLKPEEFKLLADNADSPPQISDELLCKYFTVTGKSGTRFVLFDDLETLRLKLKLADSLNIDWGFLMYPEWEMDVLARI